MNTENETMPEGLRRAARLSRLEMTANDWRGLVSHRRQSAAAAVQALRDLRAFGNQSAEPHVRGRLALHREGMRHALRQLADVRAEIAEHLAAGAAGGAP